MEAAPSPLNSLGVKDMGEGGGTTGVGPSHAVSGAMVPAERLIGMVGGQGMLHPYSDT